MDESTSTLRSRFTEAASAVVATALLMLCSACSTAGEPAAAGSPGRADGPALAIAGDFPDGQLAVVARDRSVLHVEDTGGRVVGLASCPELDRFVTVGAGGVGIVLERWALPDLERVGEPTVLSPSPGGSSSTAAVECHDPLAHDVDVALISEQQLDWFRVSGPDVRGGQEQTPTADLEAGRFVAATDSGSDTTLVAIGETAGTTGRRGAPSPAAGLPTTADRQVLAHVPIAEPESIHLSPDGLIAVVLGLDGSGTSVAAIADLRDGDASTHPLGLGSSLVWLDLDHFLVRPFPGSDERSVVRDLAFDEVMAYPVLRGDRMRGLLDGVLLVGGTLPSVYDEEGPRRLSTVEWTSRATHGVTLSHGPLGIREGLERSSTETPVVAAESDDGGTDIGDLLVGILIWLLWILLLLAVLAAAYALWSRRCG